MCAGKEFGVIQKLAVSVKSNPDDEDTDTGSRIDHAKGIVNAAYNEQLYHELLADFKVGHGADTQKIKDAVEAGEYQSAHRLAHTLKSTSKLIGADDLSNAALAVEKALGENKSDGMLPKNMWETLEREFTAVIAELEQFASEAAPDVPHVTGELNKVKALDLIQKLEPLLTSGRTDSLHFLDDIRETLAPAGEEYAQLIERIKDFDFAEAAERLSRIKLNITG
jgi:HPt (histidine-containing phosphotransfer) domain-containing protein